LILTLDTSPDSDGSEDSKIETPTVGLGRGRGVVTSGGRGGKRGGHVGDGRGRVIANQDNPENIQSDFESSSKN
jgi:hypothetical protein